MFIRSELVIGAVLSVFLLQGGCNTFQKKDVDNSSITIGSSPVLGAKSAPVTIVAFLDLQCPYCMRELPKIKQIQNENPSKVKFVFKHFPLSFHKKSKPAHAALELARLQGGDKAFWKMLDLIEQQPTKLDIAVLRLYAEKLNLNMAKFDAVMADASQINKLLENDIAQGKQLGVNGTPTVFINGEKMVAREVSDYKARIDDILSNGKRLAKAKNNGAILTFEKTVCDLGEISVREKKDCELKFKNTGKGLLAIGEIKSTCGCTVPSLAKKEYKPGEDGVIKISYSGQSNSGAVAKHIYVSSNDGANPKIALTLKAAVTEQIIVTPAKLNLNLDKDNAGMPEISIKSKDGAAFSIKSFTVNNDVIKADCDSNAAAEFIIKPKADLAKLKNNTAGIIRVIIDHPKCSSITIPYEVLTRFSVQPGRLVFLIAEPNTPEKRDIVVKNNYGENFEIASVSSRHGFVKLISESKNQNSVKLTVEVTPPLSSENHFADSIDIDLKDGEHLTIPCSGFYKSVIDSKSKPLAHAAKDSSQNKQ